ncbi:MAG: MFS transporter small subunit [Chthoniobacterales bacterium]
MNEPESSSSALMLLISWTVVGIPLAWGVWTTLLKLPALFH